MEFGLVIFGMGCILMMSAAIGMMFKVRKDPEACAFGFVIGGGMVIAGMLMAIHLAPVLGKICVGD